MSKYYDFSEALRRVQEYVTRLFCANIFRYYVYSNCREYGKIILRKEVEMNIVKSKSGESMIDTVIIVFVVVMMLAFSLSVLPVIIEKSKLDTFSEEVVRFAEIEGKIGSATSSKINKIKAATGFNPIVKWSKVGKIQLNEEFSLILTIESDIGFFSFGSFPVTLTSKATGRSEVYWKN